MPFTLFSKDYLHKQEMSATVFSDKKTLGKEERAVVAAAAAAPESFLDQVLARAKRGITSATVEGKISNNREPSERRLDDQARIMGGNSVS